MWLNEIKDNSNQVFAQQSILAELIISTKWFIKAKPGVKDFVHARDRALYLPVLNPHASNKQRLSHLCYFLTFDLLTSIYHVITIHSVLVFSKKSIFLSTFFTWYIGEEWYQLLLLARGTFIKDDCEMDLFYLFELQGW